MYINIYMSVWAHAYLHVCIGNDDKEKILLSNMCNR